jgi:glucose/arabinose dehydrogenase
MRNRPRTARVLALTLATVTLIGAAACSASAAVTAKRVRGGLNDPAAFTFTPTGRIIYVTRGTGRVHVLDLKAHTDRVIYDIGGVDGSGERGALGIALHPKWPASPYVYVYVTRTAKGALRNQVLRIRVKGGKGVGARTILQSPASSSPYHNGGRILFGPDKKLYVFVGDGHNSANAQDRTANLRGKVLRVNPDGSAPSDNPIKGSRIWSFGNRNSFGFTFDPQTDRLWETENGPGCNDEINLIRKGDNYGWGANESCGSSPTPTDTNNSGPAPRRMPALWFRNTIGITGAAFCHGCGLGPALEGDLLFGCVVDGRIRRVNLNAARTDFSGGPTSLLGTPNGAVYSMETSPNGTIYFSDSDAIYRLVGP